MLDIIKTIQTSFSYCQADIFGPILAYNSLSSTKHWVLVVLCLFSRAVHLELLHNYFTQSVTMGFRRTFALRGTPCIIWIDAGLNITKAGKDLVQYDLKVVSDLNIKFSTIKFKTTLPKHHEGIGAVELVIGVIKNRVSKSITGPNQVKMGDKELLTWLNLVIQKINNRLLILSTSLGLTLTPNPILNGFRNTHQSRNLGSASAHQVAVISATI